MEDVHCLIDLIISLWIATDARAIAIGEGKDREFVDALDFDIKIAECLFTECTGGLLECCALEAGQECTCVE